LIAERLGHSPTVLTQDTCTHVTQSQQTKASSKLSKMLGVR
jgi:hypothetical protein